MISCMVTKPRDINTIKISTVAIDSFYSKKNIPNYLVLKDKNGLQNLLDKKLFIPDQVILFDENGKQINFNPEDKSCGAIAPNYLKNYNTKKDIIYTDETLSNFITNFKWNTNSEFKTDSNKPTVFFTTSVYAEKYKINKQMFELYNLYKDTYNVYIVNTDYNSDWEKQWGIKAQGYVTLPVKLL